MNNLIFTTDYERLKGYISSSNEFMEQYYSRYDIYWSQNDFKIIQKEKLWLIKCLKNKIMLDHCR